MLLRHVDAGHAALGRGDWEDAKTRLRGGTSGRGNRRSARRAGPRGVVARSRRRRVRRARARLSHLSRTEQSNGRGARGRVARVGHVGVSRRARDRHGLAAAGAPSARRSACLPPNTHGWRCAPASRRCFTTAVPKRRPRSRQEAISIGEAIGSSDYAVAGRALHGYAEITAGRVTDGLRELDEVSASVLAGEVKDYVLMGLACCYLIAACDRIRDYDRATQWCDRLKESCRKWGLRPLFAVCRTQYASVCMWRGAWDEAERELSAATDELAACRPAMTGEGLARLGELRRRQGKLDEATALFERAGAHPMASLGRAMRGVRSRRSQGGCRAGRSLSEKTSAAEQNRARRRPRAADPRADRARRNRVDAQKALEELRDIAARAQTDPLRASASLAAGVVAAAVGRCRHRRGGTSKTRSISFRRAARRSRPRGRVSSWRACSARSGEPTRRPKRLSARSRSSRSCTRTWSCRARRRCWQALSRPRRLRRAQPGRRAARSAAD